MNHEVCMTENECGPIQKTRYKLLGYQHQGHRYYGRWRIIDKQTGNAIGPLYVYKCELLADLDRVAEVYGY